MKSPSQLSPADTPLFLDTSVVINLIASRFFEDLHRALNRPFLIEKAVMLEMKRDPRDGKDGTEVMRELTARGVLTLVNMNEQQTDGFLQLVGAPVPDDLGDGEAATIACAIGSGCAVIDDRKARRIITQGFPSLVTYCTLDLLCSEQAFSAMSEDVIIGAVKCALRDGRMHVPREWKAFVSSILTSSSTHQL